MKKVVIFDSGYGGEMAADKLEKELPILEVIRVIDWRHTTEILKGSSSARKAAEVALAPYIGKADLIIFANHLLTLTSLKYFRRKYPDQKFLGLELISPDTFVPRDVLILTTRAVSRTLRYQFFVFQIKRRVRTLTVDDWPYRIDEDDLSRSKIIHTIDSFLAKNPGFRPEEVVLACSNFSAIKNDLKKALGHNLKIYDSLDSIVRQTSRALHLRGIVSKRSRRGAARLRPPKKCRKSVAYTAPSRFL